MTTTAIDRVGQELREEFPFGTTIPLDRLEDGIATAAEYGDDYVTVKIPSFHEFTLTPADAADLVAAAKSCLDRWGMNVNPTHPIWKVVD